MNQYREEIEQREKILDKACKEKLNTQKKLSKTIEEIGTEIQKLRVQKKEIEETVLNLEAKRDFYEDSIQELLDTIALNEKKIVAQKIEMDQEHKKLDDHQKQIDKIYEEHLSNVDAKRKELMLQVNQSEEVIAVSEKKKQELAVLEEKHRQQQDKLINDQLEFKEAQFQFNKKKEEQTAKYKDIEAKISKMDTREKAQNSRDQILNKKEQMLNQKEIFQNKEKENLTLKRLELQADEALLLQKERKINYLIEINKLDKLRHL